MDELDKKLYHDMHIDVPIPDKCRTIIKESLYNEEKIKRVHYRSLTRIVLTVLISLLATTGIVYAGTKVYEKIFTNPEKVVGFYAEDNSEKYLNQIKDSTISKENALNEMNKLLKKFNHENEKIETIELFSNSENYQLIWEAKTDKNNSILINADDKNSFNVVFNSTLDESTTNHNNIISEDEAIDIAKSLCKKYGYEVSDYTYIRAYTNTSSDTTPYIWYVDFFKEYEGIVNPFQRINIGFIPQTNNIYVFGICDTEFENNSIELTSEQAKEIVLDEEKKIDTEYKIDSMNLDLCIVSTNDNAYLRTNDYEQYYKQSNASYPIENIIEYRVDRRIRRAWVATVNYDIAETENKLYESSNIYSKCFSYFVDVTTGEIIGGADNYESIEKFTFKQ